MKQVPVLLLLAASLSWAGYGLEWSFQANHGWPGISLDVNRDNLPDISVSYAPDSLVYYDGVSRAHLWTIPNPPENTTLGATYGNTGGDNWPELVVYGYHYTTSVYYSRFDVYDCGNHQCQFSSPEFSSNYTIPFPYLTDVDGDGRCEICVTSGDSVTPTLKVYGSTAAVEESPPTSEAPRFSATPSVSRAPVLISGLPPTRSPVQIVDASGRIVRTLTPASRGPVVWDGTDGHSRTVPPGCYLVRADGQITKVITLP